jgi:predicted MFS family arabinose efflux permease
MLMFFGIGLYVIYLPTWLEHVVGVSGNEIASLFFVGGIANVVAGPLAGKLSDRVGRKPLIVTSCLGFAMVMVATTYLIDGILVAYFVFAAAMVMVALRISPLLSLMTALVPDQRRGMMMSLVISIGQIGMAIGSGIAGPAYTRYGYISNTLIGAVAMVLMAFLVQRMLPEPRRESPDVVPEAAGVAEAPSS